MTARKTAIPVVLVLIGTLAGCRATAAALASGPADSGPVPVSTAAAGPGGSASSPGAARQPRPGAGPTRPAASKAKAATAKAAATATRKTTSAAAGGPSAATGAAAGTWLAVPPTAGSSGAAPVTGSSPATPPVTATPPHDDQTTSPPTPTIAPGVAPCTVTGSAPVVQHTVTSSEAQVAQSVFFDVSEYDATGAVLAQVVITVHGPFTVGEVITGTGAANASMAYCQFTAVTQDGY